MRVVRPGRVYLQWCARSGLMLQHLGHLYTTWPGFSCKLSMNSLVAFPLGTAPCAEKDRRQSGLDGGPVGSDTPPWTQSFQSSGCTHRDGTRPPRLGVSVFRIMPTPMNIY